MANHFEAVGMAVGGREQFAELVVALVTAGEVRRVSARISDHTWTDPSGARLVAQTDGGGIELAMPCLAGSCAAVPVRNVRMTDAETATLELLDGHGEPICPLAVELEDRSVLSARGGRLESGALTLAALAEQIDVHADEDAYYAAQQDGRAKFAADFLIPSGLFPPGRTSDGWTPAARAMFAGRVLQAQTKTNTRTGGAFHHLKVRTIAAIELDVAVSGGGFDHPPASGSIVSGTFFMTGRLGL
ncbi:hypothetical protein KGA66_24965 [Actinocrinis puniceicyclus]|uniref:Uncharacterized protein n=1 Tax=Actinocrinis puniceicyclus TaxID=977794 RepID=A0A8J8BFM6_9ACTN|nr:hypothetical protein [Actinocrinis puniceicyclus]MBS2966321.1 hypothetical protein [Actinocrinis puniceicyclus]